MKQTKLILTSIAFILTVLVFVQACKKGNAVDLSGTYTINSGENLHIPENKNDATISASNFADSRCPINADCVWAGVATGNFTLKDKTNEQTIELCLGACDVVKKPKTQNITLNGVIYTIELTEVTPYPGTTKEKSKATIVLKKK